MKEYAKCLYYENACFDNPIVTVRNGQNRKHLTLEEVVDCLNEQQELIEELHISDHMGWGRAEKFEKELKQKKIYIKRLEYKVQKFKEMNGEQQATINELKEENDKLIQKNCIPCELVNSQTREIDKLKEENEKLRRLFEEMKQPITINLTEEEEKELRKLLGLIDDE